MFLDKILFFFNKHPILKKIALPIYNFFHFIYNYIKTYIMFPLFGGIRIIYSFVNSNYMKNLRMLKFSKNGKRCFIIATGPSLLVDDVNSILKKGEITFGLNSIYKMYSWLIKKPTYYVCADDDYVKQLLKDTNNTYFENKAESFSFTDLAVINKKIKNNKNLIFIPYNRLFHGWRNFMDSHFKFSINPIFGFYDYYTVTSLAINIAAYMGFSEIYLIGVDCNCKGHAQGIQTGLENKYSMDFQTYIINGMKKGYEYLNIKLSKKGIKIYNATRGGELEVFPRVNLDEVLKNDNSNQ